MLCILRKIEKVRAFICSKEKEIYREIFSEKKFKLTRMIIEHNINL